MLEYIKADYKGLPFPLDFADGKQFWKRPFQFSPTGEQIAIMVDSGMLMIDEDIPILTALLNLNMLTLDMLLDLFPDKTPEQLIAQIKRLSDLKLVNMFLIAKTKRDEKEKFPTDGLVIYTLDLGGKQVLIQYGNPVDLPERWQISNVCMGVPKITIQLVMSETFIALKRILKQNLIYFEPARYLRFTGATARFGGEFAVNYKGVAKYFFVVYADDENIVPSFRDNMDGVIGYLPSKACLAHFAPDVEPNPVVIVVAQNEEIAHEAADIINRKCEIMEIPHNFRYVTYESIKRDISEGKTFMKYIPAANDAPSSMKYVKSAVFTDMVWDAPTNESPSV